MKKYQISYKTYDPETNKFRRSSMSWDADDTIHAINQLLEYYRPLREKVAVIEEVDKIG